MTTTHVRNPLLGRALPGRQWVVDVGLTDFPYLAGHRLQGMVVVPGSTYLQMAMAAVEAATGHAPSTVEDLVFDRAFVVPGNGSRSLRLSLLQGERGDWEFTATGEMTGVRHASARIPRARHAASATLLEVIHSTESAWRDGVELAGSALYDRLHAVENEFGPEFRCVERCRVGDGWALGTVCAPMGEARTLPGCSLSPAMVDAAMQVLIAGLGPLQHTYALAGCERVRVHHRAAIRGRAYARLGSTPRGRDIVGDVLLIDETGELVAELTGVRVRRLPLPVRAPPPATIGIAATFTADPVADSLSFWFDLLDLPVSIEFAPYGQLFQQLLDPTSLLSSAAGASVLMIRPEDLLRRGQPTPQPSEIRGLRYETEFLYHEIFTRQAYLRHGIELPDGACVFDVGANVGMFTLFVHSRCAGPRVFAFEPAPRTFELLRANTKAQCPDTVLFDCGLAEADGQRRFTYYPHSSAFSGFAADPARDRRSLDAVVRNLLRPRMAEDSPDFAELVDRLTRERLDATVSLRPIRTLSSVIAEYGVEGIDLLKIDAERSELQVLAGIADEHWPLIRQVVAEVHDPADAEPVREVLARHGFAVALDEPDELLRGTGFVHVFARRPRTSRRNVEPDALARNTIELVRAVEAFCQQSSGPCVVAVVPAIGCCAH